MLKNITRIGTLALITLALGTFSFAEGTGADTYKAKCQMCHAPDGSGNTPAGKAMKALPLTEPDVVKKSDADLIAITKAGKGKMPAYTGKLSDADIKEVVAYIRTLQKK